MKTFVIIPTYNERENLEPLTEQILALSPELHVVVVDDNSPDGTGQLADELARRHREVHVVHRPGKLGLGTAYRAGFKYALDSEADLVMTMDADFSHHPRYIPRLVALTESCDLAIGSRYVDGGGVRNWGLKRSILSSTANLIARTALNLRAHDCTAGFRCYRREVLEGVNPDSVLSSGYSFLVEMLFRCQRLGYKVGEVPIIFENRQHGQSKISQREIYKAVYTVLRLSLERLLGRKKGYEVQERDAWARTHNARQSGP
jgi:dolichol-phosphate mannosyltransferase